jgi:hypothetical protein
MQVNRARHLRGGGRSVKGGKNRAPRRKAGIRRGGRRRDYTVMLRAVPGPLVLLLELEAVDPANRRC